MDTEEEERKKVAGADEEEELGTEEEVGRGPSLWLSDQVQTRRPCPQQIPSLDDLTLEKDSVRGEEAFFLLLGFSFFSLFSVRFMNHQLLFKRSQSQLGEKVSPKTHSTACVYLKSSQTLGNRTL